MYKETHGFAPQICDSAALLSFSVRPVRFIPVPCRSANLWRKTPQDPKTVLEACIPLFTEGIKSRFIFLRCFAGGIYRLIWEK